MQNEVSIPEAIQLSGLSKATFYRKFLTSGKLSTKEKSNGKKFVDLAELLRVIPEVGTSRLETKPREEMDGKNYHFIQELNSKIAVLSIELKGQQEQNQILKDQIVDLKEQLRKAEDREAYLQRIVEQQHPPEQKKIGWWGRFVGRKD